MKNSYVIDFLNENYFREKERALKKYNMLAYKKLIFEFYLIAGNSTSIVTYSLVFVNRNSGEKFKCRCNNCRREKSGL